MRCDHKYGATASRGVPVYAPAFAGTYLYCLVTEARRWTTAQDCYMAAWRVRLEPVTVES